MIPNSFYPKVRYYKLEGKKVIPVKDVLEWANSFEYSCRQIADDKIDNYAYVSTVFLGIDHNFLENGSPLLFETAVFKLKSISEQISSSTDIMEDSYYLKRYSTYDDALEGHKQTVENVKQILSTDRNL